MSESTEQIAVVQWFRFQYPKYRLISVPNGQMIGGRNKFALINKYKKEGMFPGVSDLFLCVPKNGYNGLWLEMKAKGKTASSLSSDQRLWLSDMVEIGYRAEWAAGFDQAKGIIEEYLQ
jgi:hypothetical protein